MIYDIISLSQFGKSHLLKLVDSIEQGFSTFLCLRPPRLGTPAIEDGSWIISSFGNGNHITYGPVVQSYHNNQFFMISFFFYIYHFSYYIFGEFTFKGTWTYL
jgi:hypothetical protein